MPSSGGGFRFDERMHGLPSPRQDWPERRGTGTSTVRTSGYRPRLGTDGGRPARLRAAVPAAGLQGRRLVPAPAACSPPAPPCRRPLQERPGQGRCALLRSCDRPSSPNGAALAVFLSGPAASNPSLAGGIPYPGTKRAFPVRRGRHPSAAIPRTALRPAPPFPLQAPQGGGRGRRRAYAAARAGRLAGPGSAGGAPLRLSLRRGVL